MQALEQKVGKKLETGACSKLCPFAASWNMELYLHWVNVQGTPSPQPLMCLLPSTLLVSLPTKSIYIRIFCKIFIWFLFSLFLALNLGGRVKGRAGGKWRERKVGREKTTIAEWTFAQKNGITFEDISFSAQERWHFKITLFFILFQNYDLTSSEMK